MLRLRCASHDDHNWKTLTPSIKKPFSAPEKGFFVLVHGLGPLLANTLESEEGAAALPAFLPFFYAVAFVIQYEKVLVAAGCHGLRYR